MQPSDRKDTAHFPERTTPDGRGVANKILLSIPEHEFLAIGPHLEPIALPRHCESGGSGERRSGGSSLRCVPHAQTSTRSGADRGRRFPSKSEHAAGRA